MEILINMKLNSVQLVVQMNECHYGKSIFLTAIDKFRKFTLINRLYGSLRSSQNIMVSWKALIKV